MQGQNQRYGGQHLYQVFRTHEIAEVKSLLPTARNPCSATLHGHMRVAVPQLRIKRATILLRLETQTL